MESGVVQMGARGSRGELWGEKRTNKLESSKDSRRYHRKMDRNGPWKRILDEWVLIFPVGKRTW